MLPQKSLTSGSSEMPFTAFWTPNYHPSMSGNYGVCMAIWCEINVKKHSLIPVLGTGQTILLTKRERCICTRKCQVVLIFNFPLICLCSFPAFSGGKKHILGLFADPPDRWQKPWLDQLVAADNLDLNQMRVTKMMIKHWNGRSNIIIFLTQASMIFIQKMQLSFKFWFMRTDTINSSTR